MLTRQEIRAIIKSQGLNAHIREIVSKQGDGTSKTYIHASKWVGRVKGNVDITLGKLEDVAQMSQDELAETVKRKFAERLEQKVAEKARIIESTK